MSYEISNKEAIKWMIEHHGLHCPDDGTMDYGVHSMATEALKKQTPMKPIYWCNMQWICPNCHRAEYINNEPLWTHCGFCGQAIDWSEVDT